jgi:nucleotide-binding universal stress UspA family protein
VTNFHIKVIIEKWQPMHRLRVLVPVSFSPQSDMALKLARLMASQFNVMITCLYVIEKPGFITGMVMSGEMEKKIRREAEVQLSTRVNKIIPDSDKVSFELIISSGKTYRKILEKASELNVNMIIMGKSDSTDLKKQFLGSNATRVIAKSPIPVLTVHEVKATANKYIVLPLDLTTAVSVKIAKALEIAELLGARMTVCTFLGHSETRFKQAFQERLDLIEKIFAENNIQCKTQVIETENVISGEIIRFAKSVKADSIFMMIREESDLTGMFIGSTAYEVIRKSDIPVISVTPNIQTNLYTYKALSGLVKNPLVMKDAEDSLIHN